MFLKFIFLKIIDDIKFGQFTSLIGKITDIFFI